MKLVGILLLLILSVPILGTYALLQYEKAQTKRETKRRIIAGIAKEELERFAFSKQESQTLLHWKHSKEFEYKNEMYDVVEANETGDSIIYWCWWDHEETQLNKQLKNLVEQILGHSSQKKENQKRLFRFLDTLFLQAIQEWKAVAFTIPQKAVSVRLEYFNQVEFSPPAPPPEAV